MFKGKLSNRLLIWTLIAYFFLPVGAGHGGGFMGVLLVVMLPGILDHYSFDILAVPGLFASLTIILMLLTIFIKNAVVRDILYFLAVAIATVSMFVLNSSTQFFFSFVFALPFFVLVAVRIVKMFRGTSQN